MQPRVPPPARADMTNKVYEPSASNGGRKIAPSAPMAQRQRGPHPSKSAAAGGCSAPVFAGTCAMRARACLERYSLALGAHTYSFRARVKHATLEASHRLRVPYVCSICLWLTCYGYTIPRAPVSLAALPQLTCARSNGCNM